ncbi:MAG: TIGR00269 family protein [Nanoarchaeota archaeon]
MKCAKCKQAAVFLSPTLCKKHFLVYVEKKVAATIKKYKLVTKKDKVVVAVSGGKDSLTILYLLRKYTKNIVALCIDEGIAGYRATTIEDMKRFCEKYDVQYHIVSYKEEVKYSLDEMKVLLKEKPCTICGAFRRYFLNKKARELGATKLVTGHNMDDESQAIVMNLLRHQPDILPRLGPMTGAIKDSKFIPRVKPLYFLSEKEIAAYALLQDFGIHFTECPNVVHAYRAGVGDLLNTMEKQYPGTKERVVKQFVAQLPKIRKKFMHEEKVEHCQSCGEPSAGSVCKACQLLVKIKETGKVA